MKSQRLRDEELCIQNAGRPATTLPSLIYVAWNTDPYRHTQLITLLRMPPSIDILLWMLYHQNVGSKLTNVVQAELKYIIMMALA